MIPLISAVIRLFRKTRRVSLIIYKPDRFGDFILALETMRKLTSRFGESNSLIIVSPQGRNMARRFLPGVPLLCLESGCDVRKISQLPQLFREFCRLSSLKADTLVSLKHHKREIDYIYERVLKAKEAFSIRGDLSIKSLSSLVKLSIPYPEKSSPGLCREILAHRDIWYHVSGERVSPLTLAPVFPSPSMPGGHGPTIISPFGSNPLRDIRPDQVYRFLPDQQEASIVIGSRDQEDKLDIFARQLEALGAVNVSTRVFPDMDTYIEAIQTAGFVISTETATAHFAIAYDRPGIGFLGGGHFGYFAPWGQGRFKWIYEMMDCYHCGWKCCHEKVLCLDRL